MSKWTGLWGHLAMHTPAYADFFKGFCKELLQWQALSSCSFQWIQNQLRTRSGGCRINTLQSHSVFGPPEPKIFFSTSRNKVMMLPGLLSQSKDHIEVNIFEKSVIESTSGFCYVTLIVITGPDKSHRVEWTDVVGVAGAQ